MIKEIVKLWGHQKTAVERAVQLPEFAFFFEQGCGKTLATITTLRHKYFEKKRLMRTIIFCPPIVIDNWRNEFLKYSAIKSWDILTLTGSQKERVQNLYMFGFQEENKKRIPLGKILIVNYEALLMIDLMRLIYAWKPEVLVCDESHRCKDPKAKRSQVLFTLTKDMKLRYILSGTPILNSPMDIYAQFRILDDGATFTNNFFAFRAKYFYDKNAGMPKQKYFPDWQPKPGCEEEIHALIAKKSMRVTKAECLDLPPLVTQNIYVELSPEQRRMYEDMKADFVAFLGDSACVATLAITKGLRLLQIVSGFVSVEETDGTNDRKNIQFEDNPRAKVLSELLTEITPHSKVLVWAVFKENYATIRDICNALGVGFVEVHGEVSHSEKMEAVAKFNSDPTCRVFLGHPGSGGIGINLVAASYSIFYSRNFSLEQDLQAEARNHRGGSEVHAKITRINLVAKDTIDEAIMEALANKISISDKILKDIVLKNTERRGGGKKKWTSGNSQNQVTQ